MTDRVKNELIGQLKSEVHKNPDLTTMGDKQMREFIEKLLEANLITL